MSLSRGPPVIALFSVRSLTVATRLLGPSNDPLRGHHGIHIAGVPHGQMALLLCLIISHGFILLVVLIQGLRLPLFQDDILLAALGLSPISGLEPLLDSFQVVTQLTERIPLGEVMVSSLPNSSIAGI